MSLSQFTIGCILAIQAYLLLSSPSQRYTFHEIIESVKSRISCDCIQNWGYEYIQKIRYFVIALIFSGSFSLITSSNIIVGIIAQLIWMVTQINIFYQEKYLSDFNNIKNILIQSLFLIILIGQLCKQCHTKKKEQPVTKKIQEKKITNQKKNNDGKKEQPVNKKVQEKKITNLPENNDGKKEQPVTKKVQEKKLTNLPENNDGSQKNINQNKQSKPKVDDKKNRPKNK